MEPSVIYCSLIHKLSVTSLDNFEPRNIKYRIIFKYLIGYNK